MRGQASHAIDPHELLPRYPLEKKVVLQVVLLRSACMELANVERKFEDAAL